MDSRRLVTSALPYVNNEPHLGNLIQMLSADVFARFCRSRGYDTLYICGTDEYGTATETKALQEHKTPQELCDFYHNIHEKIYKWFDISFDYFGRTSTKEQTQIVQELFWDLDKKGYIKEKAGEQLFCPNCNRFLADRYILGVCPDCGYAEARGDQCEKCGKLLEPTELKDPKCAVCGGTPELKATRHLYLDLVAIQKKYEPWLKKTSSEGRWAKNALQMTLGWLKTGLKERAITRDLKWGVKVPKLGFENKVFYVWFDAPIGYISITMALANKLKEMGLESFNPMIWWQPDSVSEANDLPPVKLFQFIGKDNIPFHTVIFPSTLLGSGKNWTKLYHMSSSEYLNYESGKFSKSHGIGVFGGDAMTSGIKADAWRFYIFYNRPEKQDTQFMWKDFQDKYNGELIGNMGNLVNRTLLFVTKYFNGIIPDAQLDEKLLKIVNDKVSYITELLEWAELKDAFHEIFAICDIANKAFQSGEPWKTRNTNMEVCAKLIRTLCYVIKDVMIMTHPYMPQYANTVMSFFNKEITDSTVFTSAKEGVLSWADIGKYKGLDRVNNTYVYFTPLTDKVIDEYRKRYAGKQSEREQKTSEVDIFNKKISLKVAVITSIDKNPQSDKLYIEHLDDGSGVDRVIQSGLVPYLSQEELLGKHIILADNLAPKKMRGIESHGMLLAADYKDSTGKNCVEVLEAPWALAGTPVVLQGATLTEKPQSITADDFFSVNILVKDNNVVIENTPLLVDGKCIVLKYTTNGEVH